MRNELPKGHPSSEEFDSMGAHPINFLTPRSSFLIPAQGSVFEATISLRGQ